MTFKLTLKKVLYFDNPFSYYDYNKIAMYIFVDDSGRKFVWKTTGRAEYADLAPIAVDDTMELDATVKEETVYRGENQTVLTRCRKFRLVSRPAAVVETAEETETDEEKAEKQLASLSDGDIVMTLDYARYKKHYSDCERVAGSYRAYGKNNEIQLVDVIVRDGRLVKSGVRGKHYSLYCFYDIETESGKDLVAISETTARRRLGKGNWVLSDIKEKNARGFWV